MSHTIHTVYSFPALHFPSSLLPTLSPKFTPTLFPLKKRPPRDNSQIGQNRIQYDKEKSHIETGRGNPMWGGASRTCKGSEIQLLPLLGVPQIHQVDNLNTWAEDLVQTSVGPLLAASVSVRLCELCLVDLLGLVLLVSSIPNYFYSLFFFRLWSF